MSEWLKEHAWKACVGETLPRVRIPLSPPIKLFYSDDFAISPSPVATMLPRPRDCRGVPTVESRFQPLLDSGACTAASSSDRHAPPVPESPELARPASPNVNRTCGVACAARCSIVQRVAQRDERSPEPPPSVNGEPSSCIQDTSSREGVDGPEVQRRAARSMARIAVGRLSAMRPALSTPIVARTPGPCRSRCRSIRARPSRRAAVRLHLRATPGHTHESLLLSPPASNSSKS